MQHSMAYRLAEIAVERRNRWRKPSSTGTIYHRMIHVRPVHPYHKKPSLPPDTFHRVRNLWKVHIEAAISQANQYSDTHECLDLTRYVSGLEYGFPAA